MSFRLEKAEVRELERHAAGLSAARGLVESVVGSAQRAVEQALATVDDAVRAYNARAVEARRFVGRVAERLRDEHDEKGERWQESERGQAAAQFAEEWEEAEDDLGQMEALVLPPLDVEDSLRGGWGDELLRRLPEEASE